MKAGVYDDAAFFIGGEKVCSVDSASFDVAPVSALAGAVDVTRGSYLVETTIRLDAELAALFGLARERPAEAHVAVDGHALGVVDPASVGLPGEYSVIPWPHACRALDAAAFGWIAGRSVGEALAAWARLSPGKRRRLNRRLRGGS